MTLLYVIHRTKVNKKAFYYNLFSEIKILVSTNFDVDSLMKSSNFTFILSLHYLLEEVGGGGGGGGLKSLFTLKMNI